MVTAISMELAEDWQTADKRRLAGWIDIEGSGKDLRPSGTGFVESRGAIFQVAKYIRLVWIDVK